MRLTALMLCTGLAAAAQAPDAADLTWRESIRKFDARPAESLRQVDQQVQAGPFQPDWQSLQNYHVPEWYQDAKFGVFLHWGVYSVPAFGNEWYPRNMYVQG